MTTLPSIRSGVNLRLPRPRDMRGFQDTLDCGVKGWGEKGTIRPDSFLFTDTTLFFVRYSLIAQHSRPFCGVVSHHSSAPSPRPSPPHRSLIRESSRQWGRGRKKFHRPSFRNPVKA